MTLSEDQITFLDAKIERFEGQVKQQTEVVQKMAENIKTAKHPETTTKKIQEYAEKLNNNREVLQTLQLIKSVVEEEPDYRRMKFAFNRALDNCVQIKEKYFRRVLMDIIRELMF